MPHAPAAEDSCDSCHEPVSEQQHEFRFTEEGAELCTQCHDEFSGKVQHAPAAEGQCTACHDSHGSATDKLLTSSSIGELCAECHEELTEDLKFVHGPVAAGACTLCHNPHASDHPVLLPGSSTPDLCMKCHTAMQTRMTEKAYKHAPVEDDCVSCHNPHGAGNNMMLNDSPPGLCIECHDAIGEVMEDATVTHDALTTGKSCVDCHQAHASDVEHVLLKEPMDLCLSCHDKELESGEGKILNIARTLQENPSHHGPITDKNCSGCHEVHGGKYFRMLLEEFPAGFYTPFEEAKYALCFTCHEPDLVLDEETDELTNFRNGEWNMHYLHVNRAVKGRTCRACHNAHASQRPKHITETVPFGEWQLPVNFKQTAKGGTCQPGCHRAYGYDREKPVENVPKS